MEREGKQDGSSFLKPVSMSLLQKGCLTYFPKLKFGGYKYFNNFLICPSNSDCFYRGSPPDIDWNKMDVEDIVLFLWPLYVHVCGKYLLEFYTRKMVSSPKELILFLQVYLMLLWVLGEESSVSHLVPFFPLLLIVYVMFNRIV